MQIKRWLLSFNDEWHISKVQNSFVLQLFSWKLCNLRAISFDLAFCDKNLVDSNQRDIWYESEKFVSDHYIRLTFDLHFAIKNGWKNDDFFRTMCNGYSTWFFDQCIMILIYASFHHVSLAIFSSLTCPKLDEMKGSFSCIPVNYLHLF